MTGWGKTGIAKYGAHSNLRWTSQELWMFINEILDGQGNTEPHNQAAAGNREACTIR